MRKPPSSSAPEGSDPVIEKFICSLMLRGKKSLARKIFAETLEIMKKRTKENPLDVFRQALSNVTPLIEVRPKRVGGAVYQVPTEVSPQRQQSLSVRWIVEAARERKGAPIAEKLALELLDAAAEQGGAVKKKANIQRMAQANKAFAHLAK